MLSSAEQGLQGASLDEAAVIRMQIQVLTRRLAALSTLPPAALLTVPAPGGCGVEWCGVGVCSVEGCERSALRAVGLECEGERRAGEGAVGGCGDGHGCVDEGSGCRQRTRRFNVAGGRRGAAEARGRGVPVGQEAARAMVTVAEFGMDCSESEGGGQGQGEGKGRGMCDGGEVQLLQQRQLYGREAGGALMTDRFPS